MVCGVRGAVEFDIAVLVGKFVLLVSSFVLLVGSVGESVQVLMQLVGQKWTARCHRGFPQNVVGPTHQFGKARIG